MLWLVLNFPPYETNHVFTPLFYKYLFNYYKYFSLGDIKMNETVSPRKKIKPQMERKLTL